VGLAPGVPVWVLEVCSMPELGRVSLVDYEQALRRLSHHANLTEAEGEGWSSFVGLLFEAKTAGVVPNLREPTDDLISCLDVVNRHLNGERPSASVGADKERRIDRRLGYAVAAVITSGVEHFLCSVEDSATGTSSALAMGKELWRVSCAWEAVLAGDIDSLPEHVELER
jgi:hypothetical protein